MLAAIVLLEGSRGFGQYLTRDDSILKASSMQLEERVAAVREFQIRKEMQNARVKGSFVASGGDGTGIRLAVIDAATFLNWVNGGSARPLWQTNGPRTNGDFEVPLQQPGTYYLWYMNPSSARVPPIRARKTISIDVRVSYEQSVTYR